MKFSVTTAVIVLTALWAVIVLVVGKSFRLDFYSHETRFDWQHYILSVAGGGAVILFLVNYLAMWERQEPDASIEHRKSLEDKSFDGKSFDSRPAAPDEPSRTTPMLTGPPPQPHRRGLPLRIWIALVLCVAWVVTAFVLARGPEFDLATYLLIALPSGLLLFVTVDAIGRIAGWIAADPSRALKQTLGTIGRGVATFFRVLLEGVRVR